MATIALTGGYSTVVDDADFLELQGVKFHVDICKGRPYAAVGVTIDGKHTKLKLHRILFGCPEGVKIDHRDGDGLNNRRLNLRPATSQQNSRNMKKWKAGATSKWKGVCWHGRDHIWMAMIKPSAKSGYKKFLGTFKSELEAADAYDVAARRFHGEFANLNFPTERQSLGS